jgi:hypothetical protein
MTNNLFTDLTETQSEAINGGFFNTTVTIRKKSLVVINQTSGAAIVGGVFGDANVSSGNAAFVFSSVS